MTKKETPKLGKRTGKPASPKTPSKKSKKDTGIVAGNGTGTPEGTPARATLPPIPTSLATAGEMDRMILHLRDEEKQPWTQINRLFTEKTGIKVGSTTLRLRWSTMKANFVGITIEDVCLATLNHTTPRIAIALSLTLILTGRRKHVFSG